MKRVMAIIIVLVFGFSVLAVSVARARTQTLGVVSGVKVAVTPTPTTMPLVDYSLVYPGILPDNFLYPIKMLRDRILLFLTTDPIKKTEKLLLFADKRLGASKALFEGNKVELGLSTLTKGEKYLEQAVNQAQKIKGTSKEAKILYEKLTNATLKHQEVINELLLKVPESARQTIKDVLRYSQQGYEEVGKIKS